MGNLDTTDMKCNTPVRRTEIINVPEWMSDLSLSTFPRPVQGNVNQWLTSAGQREVPPGLLLYGKVGTGKTGLGCSILKQLATTGFGDRFHWNLLTGANVPESYKVGRLNDADLIAPCWFMTWSGFLRKCFARRIEQEWWENFDEKVSALMIDDVMDTTAVLSPVEERSLREQMEWLYEPRGYSRQPRVLILTCNAQPGLWDGAVGMRIADRLRDTKRFLSVEV